MDRKAIFDQIKGGLIVSCQALEHEPLYTKEGGIMPLMAKAAAQSGAVGIRANTVRDITQIKEAVDLPVIGIIKKDYEGTPMYITVTMKEVDELVACGVDILAVQGTSALRPDGSTAAQFIEAIKAKYPEQLVMADCATIEEGIACANAGADFVGYPCGTGNKRIKTGWKYGSTVYRGNQGKISGAACDGRLCNHRGRNRMCQCRSRFCRHDHARIYTGDTGL